MTASLIGILSICIIIVTGTESTLENFFRNEKTNKIYNGKLADKDEQRWMSWLYNKENNKMVCMASLYSDRWVITTASCATQQFDNVIVGDYNMYQPDGEQCIPVANVIIHPEYNSVTYENDIALVELAYKVSFTNGRAQVLNRLSNPTLDRLEAKSCMMAGWGLSLSKNWLWPTASELQKLRLQRLNESSCENMDLNIPDTSFCFMAMRLHASPCQLDEGAPIVCKLRNKWTHVGIYSFSRVGDGCKFGPKGATQISSFRSWIRQNTTPSYRMIRAIMRNTASG